MSVLTEAFPTKLEVNGRKCQIYYDFRTVLHCNHIIEEKHQELAGEELVAMLSKFYKNEKRFTDAHVDKMFWFFSCGREKEKKNFPRKIAGINDKQPFDFEKDAELIYAGFLQQYGIDLQESDMHWWKFMILLENLGADTKISKVMELRTKDTTSKFLSKDEREFYKAMQKYYELEGKTTYLDDKARRIEEALMNGEDISQLLKE